MRSVPVRGGSQLLAVGAARPAATHLSDDLGAAFGRDAGWVEQRTGIRELRRLRPHERLVDLAIEATGPALAALPDQASIDMVITATCSENATAQLGAAVSRAVAPSAGWFDVNAACSGFSYSIAAADALIRAGDAEHVLVVAAEQMSRLVDPADLGTSIIFGDGAGAALIGPQPEGGTGIGPVVWGSDGANFAMIECDPEPPSMLRMQGQQVFRWAVQTVPGIAREACRRAGVDIADIEVFVPHQANLRIIEAVVAKLGMGAAVVVAADVRGSGNTSAASIPLALDALRTSGQVRGGELALLIGFGAGLAFAAQVVRLPG